MNPRVPSGSKVFAVNFSEQDFTKDQAIDWLKKHGYKDDRYEYTGNAHQFDQFPGSAPLVMSKQVAPGVYFIY
jgi:hypothetical protein